MKNLFPTIPMLCLLLMALMGSGCASTTQAPTTDKTAWVLGSDFAAPATGKAKVVFIRPGKFAGGAVHFGVHDGRQLIGDSVSSGYFTYECDPGQHVFSASMDNLSFLDADLLPDRIYYVKVEAIMGMWIAGVKMTPLYPGCADVNWQKMPKILSKLEKTTVSADEVAGDSQRIEGYMQRLKEYQDKSKDGGKILPEYGQIPAR